MARLGALTGILLAAGLVSGCTSAGSGPANSVSAFSATETVPGIVPSTPTTGAIAIKLDRARPQGGQGRRAQGARIRPRRDAGRLADRQGLWRRRAGHALPGQRLHLPRLHPHDLFRRDDPEEPRHRLPPGERHLAAGDVTAADAAVAPALSSYGHEACCPRRLGSVDGRDASLGRHGGSRRRRLAVGARSRSTGRGATRWRRRPRRCRSIATSSARSTATSIAA